MPESVLIGERAVGPEEAVFIIAEAGVNHNGDPELAKRLVDAAAQAGTDAVKFQTFRAEKVISPQAPKADYQLETTNASESQLEMLKRLEMPFDAFRELHAYCGGKNILFLCTPFDNGSADFLYELGVPAFKISSGEITNWPFLEHVARKGKPIILSTGMSNLGEVEDAVEAIRTAGNEKLVLLHCVSNYPADPADANLRAMQTMAEALKLPVGYSDHTPGIEVALAAVALGACVIEKHFTLDKNLPGPDHKASLEPGELAQLVAGIRTVEAALGNARKEPAKSEEGNRLVVRRSLAVNTDVPEGKAIEAAMLTALRPGNWIPPSMLAKVVGKKTARPLKAGEFLKWEDLK
jgi:N-acetylneuraminate synthase/N,N'-diacetyllegionaminate synthase